MTIEFSCQTCGRNLRVKDSFAGKIGSCPGCGEETRVPERDAMPRGSSAWLDALSEEDHDRVSAGPTLTTSLGRSRAPRRRSFQGSQSIAVLAGAIAGGVVVVVVALVLVLRRGEEPAPTPPDPAAGALT